MRKLGIALPAMLALSALSAVHQRQHFVGAAT
jgi:hypothetical protein